VELPETTRISELHFNSPPRWRGWSPDAPPPLQTYPRSYRLDASLDGVQWNTLAEGSGSAADVIISFDPVEAKFLKITLRNDVNEGEEIPWTMRRLTVYGLMNAMAQ
ncbi:MAG TPA: discoidin domain-containing protein, partial [Eudoraea sp.]|nr:discoidin domain-containing protein [Eudoraea sp.]